MSNIKRLLTATKAVSSMLEDPHPGLSSWHMIFHDRAIELRDLLLELYPTTPEQSESLRAQLTALEEEGRSQGELAAGVPRELRR